MNDGTHSFAGYTLRRASERDREHLADWIEADPFHRGRILPDFFLRNLPGEDSWAVEDARGHVVFYLKTQVGCRLHIQFGPSRHRADRERNQAALTEGLVWLEAQLAGNGFREISFDSSNVPLVLFATKRLGFEVASDELRRVIPISAAPRTPVGQRLHQPQVSERVG